ncbi:MAG TPA: DUF5985 family protein [Usitatibacter sp.]|jgi:hypothetical protein|nr:DUF5985 family protein [Usitatibacter sp.]
MNEIMLGAIALGSIAVSLFFFRFWKSTRDRFFLLFALSFLIEGVNRIVLYESVGLSEDAPIYYLIRLVAYGLILAAIIDKNRGPRRRE